MPMVEVSNGGTATFAYMSAPTSGTSFTISKENLGGVSMLLVSGYQYIAATSAQFPTVNNGTIDQTYWNTVFYGSNYYRAFAFSVKNIDPSSDITITLYRTNSDCRLLWVAI